MRRATVFSASLALLAGTSAGALAQQSLASRVAQAPDGVVRLQFDSRAGVCGDGRDVVAYNSAIFGRGFQSIGGEWSGVRCVAGPLRVTLFVEGGKVFRVRTQVGGAWISTDDRLTDLGVVPAREASAYFFSLVPSIETAPGKDRLLLPAVLADGGDIDAPLLALARDASRIENTRRQAILWLGLLGQFDELRGMYARLENDDLRESVHHAISMDESVGGRWLMERARDARAPTKLRKSAIFWAGQREATPTADLVSFYQDGSRDSDLREHTIFVLSQRRDEPATDALMRIAREDSDTRMRGKALFWLGQKNDPRVTKLIADLILKSP